ncbi:hypothetical protein HV346_13490 [Enterobacter sp. RHBSTW-00994]|uniref:hypothetical protein n=1 Tax=Enterobacteriaceae TaxID=543 RepID=UPI0015EA2181|nr:MULTISPECIES: hypothetical protein [Enterobacteriaceae]MBM3072596.1 hypothetical protein [Lelliottia sp. RWM.1]QLR43632.1 hypothetical protein HV346_13490 [Enterobacter sp. RHBSTW-00994]
MKINFRKVCMFWGGMDALYIAHYFWYKIAQKQVPFVDDILNFTNIYSDHGSSYLLVTIFVLSMLTTLSIVFSALLLFLCWDRVFCVVVAQTPLRLLLVIPSVTFLPWLVKSIAPGEIVVAIVLLLLSEVTKIGSFLIAIRLEKRVLL